MCAGREPTIHNAFSGRQISSLNIITDPVAVVEKKNNILLGNSIFISINQNSTAVYLHSAGLTENCWKIYFNFADKSYSRLKRETAETLRQLETFILWNTIDSHPQGALNVTIYFRTQVRHLLLNSASFRVAGYPAKMKSSLPLLLLVKVPHIVL